MKIKKDSWHYKVLTLLNCSVKVTKDGAVSVYKMEDNVPKDTCSYFGLLAVMLTLGLALIGLSVFTIYSLIKFNAHVTLSLFSFLFIYVECMTGFCLTRKAYNKMITWAKAKGLCKEIELE